MIYENNGCFFWNNVFINSIYFKKYVFGGVEFGCKYARCVGFVFVIDNFVGKFGDGVLRDLYFVVVLIVRDRVRYYEVNRVFCWFVYLNKLNIFMSYLKNIMLLYFVYLGFF